METRNCNEDLEDEDTCILNIDFDMNSKFMDFPSPDGSRNFTTISDIVEVVVEAEATGESFTENTDRNGVFVHDKDDLYTSETLNAAEALLLSSNAANDTISYSSSSSICLSELNKRENFIKAKSLSESSAVVNGKYDLFPFNSCPADIDGGYDVIDKNFQNNQHYEGSLHVVCKRKESLLRPGENTFNDMIPTTVEAVEMKDQKFYKKLNKKSKQAPIIKSIPMQSKQVSLIPRRKQPVKRKETGKEKQRLLWQFLLDILHDKKHNPTIMAWVDFSQGIFKIVRSQSLAKLWGVHRNKDTGVKYEFFARAMRHYYRQDIIRRIPGKKLMYQFGEKINWKTSVVITGMKRKRRSKTKTAEAPKVRVSDDN